ncbi:MAG: hypothetical protein KDI61_05335, partial [Alphaproteobacteria bacterium]|nr:hypothetical protein [Alphaproteobacteria bacterium]
MSASGTNDTNPSQTKMITICVTLSGLVALSWQVIWQLKASLALGVSAWGTAITLAVTMGGMCIGALSMGYALDRMKTVKPMRLYGILECIIGIAGLFLNRAFQIVEQVDSAVFLTSPEMAPVTYLLGIASSFGLQAICLGATVPVIALMARQSRISISALYGLNTLGAACGALLTAFIFIPWLGVLKSIGLSAATNILIGLTATTLGSRSHEIKKEDNSQSVEQGPDAHNLPSGFITLSLIVAVTGFAMFMLEVAWFRSLTAAFMSTTDAFAIMLSCVLVSLGVSARLVPYIKKQRKISLGALLAWSGITILLVTPLIERFDIYMKLIAYHEAIIFMQWFFITLYVIGIPVFLLGLALPWILDSQDRPWKWGFLYGLNSFTSIMGALAAGWIFLPTIGLARTAWLTGVIVAATGIISAQGKNHLKLAAVTACALMIAIVFESGLGRIRVQGASDFQIRIPTKIVAFYEGPSTTVSVVEYKGGRRVLFIDGFSTTEQAGQVEHKDMPYTGQYMAWMGHLPMLLHPGPKRALVICFGTGQTANAVREENPAALDIVDINPNVFRLANNFSANKNVLLDPRVKKIIMDGRAFMRRTRNIYDVITLEPMPPTFAGVNSLYSLEFYQLARSKLSPNGIIAQWLPYHL